MYIIYTIVKHYPVHNLSSLLGAKYCEAPDCTIAEAFRVGQDLSAVVWRLPKNGDSPTWMFFEWKILLKWINWG